MTLTRLVYRALRASPRELTVRGRQAAFHWLSGVGAEAGRSLFPRDGWLDSLRIRREQLAAWWQSRIVAGEKLRWDVFVADGAQGEMDRERLLERADELASGQLRIFGHAPIAWSRPDRWHRDHLLNITAPAVFFGRIDYLNVHVVGDSKNVWEPNRCGWVYPLGAAYILTGKDCYARTFAEWTSDWFRCNPYPRGVNYCSALEVALRSYAWLWALDLFRTDLATKSDLLADLLAGLWCGGRHIERNLSTYFSPNTHLTGEAFALYATGALIPEFAESARWRAKGIEILTEEADRQFYRDGTHRESSSCYQLYSADFYLHAVLIAEWTGYDVGWRIRDMANRLARRVAELSPRNRILPQFNDCDGGRLCWLASHPLDAAPTLRAAASLEPQPSGAARRKVTGGSEDLASQCDSGIVAHATPQGDYLLFRSGPFGYLASGHSHDAPTSIIVHLGGQPVIVDSGTGAYTRSKEIRDQYRQAFGKNILLVNGQGPSQPDGWFSWQRVTHAELLAFRRLPQGVHAHGRHRGFESRLGFPVAVDREVLLLEEGILMLIDRVTAQQAVEAALPLTMSPEIEIDVAASSTALSLPSGETLHIWTGKLDAARGSHVPDIRPEVIDGPYSSTYGELGHTRYLHYSLGKTKHGVLVTLLSRVGAVSLREDDGGFRLCRATPGPSLWCDLATCPACFVFLHEGASAH